MRRRWALHGGVVRRARRGDRGIPPGNGYGGTGPPRSGDRCRRAHRRDRSRGACRWSSRSAPVGRIWSGRRWLAYSPPPGDPGGPPRPLLQPVRRGGPQRPGQRSAATPRAATAESGCRQVVLLAAGLDTRAFRLTWPPGLRLFELDLPDVLAFKEHVLAGQGALPRCGRTILPIDLQAEWPAALTTAGFDPTAPTAWLAEGLLIYLTAHDATQLLARVDELSADRSQLSFEHGTIADSPLLAQAHAVPAMDQYTQLWKGGLGPAGPD